MRFEITPEEGEGNREKIERDPFFIFLCDHGFEGDPEIVYSMRVISALDRQGGKHLTDNVTFDNFEDARDFVLNNPDVFTERQRELIKEGISPWRINYGQSVYTWSGNLDPKAKEALSKDWDILFEQMDANLFSKAGSSNTKEKHEVVQEIGIGDMVQWVSQKQEQWDKPKRITGFSDDKKYAFVEGSQTGIPADQLEKQRSKK